MTFGHVFLFGFRGPKARSTLRYFNARGRQSRPCAIPGRRPGIYAPLGARPRRAVRGTMAYAENIDFNRPFPKRGDDLAVTSFFWVSRAVGPRRSEDRWGGLFILLQTHFARCLLCRLDKRFGCIIMVYAVY